MHLSICSSHLNQFIWLQGSPSQSAAQINEGASCFVSLLPSLIKYLSLAAIFVTCHFCEALGRSMWTKTTQNCCKLQHSNFFFKKKTFFDSWVRFVKHFKEWFEKDAAPLYSCVACVINRSFLWILSLCGFHCLIFQWNEPLFICVLFC